MATAMSSKSDTDGLDGCLGTVVENLRRRHPELVNGLDEATICRRFLCFHGEHVMTPASLRSHMSGERGNGPVSAAAPA